MVMLIFCGDLKYCPYLSRYTERLDLRSVKYEVVFWNRSGDNLSLPSNYYYYNTPSDLSKSKIKKGIDFIFFYQWLQNHLKIHKPEKLIILSTLTGVLLSSQLKKYQNRYIFDIRDYSFEGIKPFYEIEKKVIKNSFFTAISSNGFREFLPEYDYVLAHNFNRCDTAVNANFKKNSQPIRLVWNGVMRFFDFQRQYIDALKNDDRFLMLYHGDGPELNQYIAYCQDNNVKNVLFTGSYENTDKRHLLKEADLLNNCYGYRYHAGNKLKYAVSNRFYDGIVSHIPQLVEPVGFKSRWALQYHIGINDSASGDFADKLYEYYRSIDETIFNQTCDDMLNTILYEDDIFIGKIDGFILH